MTIPLFRKSCSFTYSILKRICVVAIALIISIISAYSQPTVPVTIFDTKQIILQTEKNKNSGIHSMITWKNEMQNGNLLMGKRKKIQTDNYGKSGLLLETEFYSEQGKTDSIATYRYDSLNLIEYILFTPVGEVLKKKVYKYYPDGTIQSIFHYLGSQNLEIKSFYFHDKKSGEIIQSDYNSFDSLLNKYYYTPDEWGLQKIRKEDGLGNTLYEKVYVKTEGKILEELFNFQKKENDYKYIIKYNLKGQISEIKIEDVEKIVTSTIIKKYDEHGNLAGTGYYTGDVVFHSDYPEKFDILNNDVKASDKKIIKLLQFTYQYY